MTEAIAGYSTPILIIGWRRYRHFEKLIDVLRGIRPINIYISIDGPRDAQRDSDLAEIKLTIKAIITCIDWNANIKLKTQQVNLGCKNGVNSAIDWFFSMFHMG